MTQKEVRDSHIHLMDDGQIALTTNRKNGKVSVLRIISREEIVNMAAVLYSMYKKDFPDKDVMAIPFDKENVFTLTMVKVTTDE